MTSPTSPQPPAPSPSSSSIVHRLWSALWPIALFLLLAIVLTWPLVTDLAHSIARHPILSRAVDVDAERWNLWWFKTAVADRHMNPFYTDMIYYPYRLGSNALSLYYNDMHPLDMFLAMPVLLVTDALTGPTLAYNLLSLFHLTFTGVAMFWLVRYLTGSNAGGLVAGILLLFSPLTQYQFQAGHLVLLAMGWMLLHILFLHRLLYMPTGTQRRWLNGGLAVLFLLATSFSNWYLTVFLLAIDGLMALARIVEARREWRRTIGSLVVVLLAWLVLVSPLLIATIRSATDATVTLVSGVDYEVSLSLTPQDLLLHSKDARVSPAVWNPGTLGFTAMALGIVGAARLRRRGTFWLILIAIGVIFSLGPYLKFDPDVREVSGTSGIPLPYLLFRSLPFMSIARVPRRFVLLADIGLGVLAGYAVAYIMERMRQWAVRLREVRWRRWAPGATVAAVVLVPLLELQTLPQTLFKVDISPFFSRLAAEKGDFGILELPVTSHYARDHDRMLNMTVHGKKIIGGYVSRFVEDYYHDPDSPFQQIADMTAHAKPDIVPPLSHLAVLNYYNIPYVIAYKQSEAYEQPQDRERVQEYVRSLFPDPSAQIYDDAQLTAYRVPPQTQTTPLLWVGDGWYPPEAQGGHTWRWSQRTATLYLLGSQPTNIRLQFTSATLRDDATLSVSVNGGPPKQFHISKRDTQADTGTLSLPAGESTITFASDTPAITPIQAGISEKDDRPLGFVVRDMVVSYPVGK